MSATDDLELYDNQARDRYELWRGSEFVGLVGYEVQPSGTLTLLHTVVESAFSRQGFARAMVRRVLDGVYERGQRIHPVCTYVQRFLRRFPEYQDLVA